VVVVAAWLAFQSRQTADADAWFARAWPQIEPANRERVALNWGLDQILAKRYEAAAAIFQRAIDEQAAEDGQGVLQFYLTRALALVGRHDDALKVAEKAAALHPKSPRLRALPAWVAYHAKRYAAAEQGYRALLQEFDGLYDPPEIREELRDARLLLSNICVLQQRRAEAEEWLEQVLDEFPEDIGALNDLAYLWVEQGRRLQRSLGMLQRAVAGDPDNVAYLDSLGWVHYQLGRYEEAVPHLEKAAAGPEPDGVILEHLGDAYLKLGRREQARAAWQRAVEAFDESGDSARRKETLQKIQRHEQ
jgi:tetratricopeptide (TPR) repeat protein